MIFNILFIVVINALFSLPFILWTGWFCFFEVLDPSPFGLSINIILISIVTVVAMFFVYFIVPDFLPKRLKNVKQQNAFLVSNFIVDSVLSGIVLACYFITHIIWLLPFVTNSFSSISIMIDECADGGMFVLDGFKIVLSMFLFIVENILKTIFMKLGFNKLNRVKYRNISG